MKMVPDGGVGFRVKKAFHPVFSGAVLLVGRAAVTRFHFQHMTDGHGRNPGMNLVGYVFREISADGVIQGDTPLLLQTADCQRDETLCHGEHTVESLSRVGRIIALEYHFPVARDEKTVHGNVVAFQPFDDT